MTEPGDTLLDRLGRWLAGRLQQESSGYEPYTPSDAETLRRTLEPGDILLVEGNQKISAAIKYLTQSTWSHAAFYVGDDFEGAAALYARLGKHKKSVACLYINKLDDVDLDVLREIIARQYAEEHQPIYHLPSNFPV